MKSLLKIFGVAVLAATVGFGFVGCGDGGGGPVDVYRPGFVDPTVERQPLTWQSVDAPLFTSPQEADRIWAVAAGTSSFVAVGGWGPNDTIAAGFSFDALTWENSAGNFRSELRTVAFGNGVFIAADVGTFHDQDVDNFEAAAMYVSTDGGRTFAGPILTGADVTGGNFTGESGLRSVISITYGGGRWLAVGLDGQMIYSTNNGSSWSRVFQNVADRLLPPGDNSAIRDAIFADGRWIVAGDRGMTAWSDNFTTWNTVTVPGFLEVQGFQRLIYFDGYVLAVGSGGNMWRSPDKGESWDEIERGAHGFGVHDIYGLAFGNGSFVIVGAGGRIRSVNWNSPLFEDGIWSHWHTRANSAGDTQALYAVAYGGGLWVVGGRSGEMFVSSVGD